MVAMTLRGSREAQKQPVREFDDEPNEKLLDEGHG